MYNNFVAILRNWETILMYSCYMPEKLRDNFEKHFDHWNLPFPFVALYLMNNKAYSNKFSPSNFPRSWLPLVLSKPSFSIPLFSFFLFCGPPLPVQLLLFSLVLFFLNDDELAHEPNLAQQVWMTLTSSTMLSNSRFEFLNEVIKTSTAS